MFRNTTIILLIIAIGICGFFAISVSADSIPVSGEDRLSSVSTALSHALDEVDANLTGTAGAFSAADMKKATANAIVAPFTVDRPGWEGVVLLIGDTVLTSLNESVIPQPLNTAVLKDTAILDSIKRINPRMSQDRIIGNSVQVVMISRPAVVNDNIGAAVAFLSPGQFCNGVIQPLLNGTDTMGLVMQVDGTILYATSPEELTKIPPENMLTEVPTFRDVKTAMMTEKSGHMIYEYWHGDQNDPKAREAYWETVNLHGTEWRVLVAPAIR